MKIIKKVNNIIMETIIKPPPKDSLWTNGNDGFEYTIVDGVIFFRPTESQCGYIMYNELLDQRLPDNIKKLIPYEKQQI